MLIPINIRDTIKATNAIKLDIAEEMNRANVTIQVGPASNIAPLIGKYASAYILLYVVKIVSAQ